ncbi:MAG: rhodanese-like domain-containing protein [Bacteroidota bacterium]
MNPAKSTILTCCLCSLMCCFYGITLASSWSLDSIHAQFSVTQCDSLVQANAQNPDFVILDVRTPAEYDPSHILGAINRDYSDPNFSVLINQLPKNKIYLIHCSGGSRSYQTYNLMYSLGFPATVNMIGGLGNWISSGLPITSTYAPLLMAVSDTVAINKMVFIGNTDTLELSVTNRANDTLKFSQIPSLAGSEFSCDFDTNVVLTGPFDYKFRIFYTPTDTLSDTLNFPIGSNGGMIQFQIFRTGKANTTGLAVTNNINPTFSINPNPCSTETSIEFESEESGPVVISLFDISGHPIKDLIFQARKGNNHSTIDTRILPAGAYILRMNDGKRLFAKRMIKM